MDNYHFMLQGYNSINPNVFWQVGSATLLFMTGMDKKHAYCFRNS